MKYTLEAYQFAISKGRKQKHICPNCGKKTFVRYIDEEGNYVGEDIGRCDREIKCGYHKKPNGQITFEKKFDIKEKEPLIIHPTIVNKVLARPHTNNNLYKFLCKKFDKEEVDEIFDRYSIGTSKDNWTIYFQFDELYRCRTGKMMLYDENGKRVKDSEGNAKIRWIHNYIEYDKEKYEMKQVYFGTHLLPLKQYESIFVCESEKNAIVCALNNIDVDDYLFIACGGKNMLNELKLIYLTNFANNVYVVPDIDAIHEWSRIAYNCNLGNISVYHWYVNVSGNISDIADLILNKI